MEEEIEIDPEIKDLDEPSPDEKLDTGPKIITNFEIIQIIFSRKTAPHAMALSIFLIVLGVLSQSSSQFLVDLILILGFGFSVGYLMTAVLMRFDFVRNFSIGDYRTILLVPLTLSLLVSLLIWYVFGFTEYGDRLKDLLSLNLVVIFVLWQFAQAWWMRVPFKELAISRMSKVVSRDQSSFGKLANVISPLFWSIVGFGIFSFLESQGTYFSPTF